jgi:Flp pilus assembly protein TadG
MKQMVSYARERLIRGAAQMRQWVGDTRGNVAIIFGITTVPLMIALGMAVDLSNQMRVQQRLAGVADAVALAAAQVSDDEQAMLALANQYMEANGASDLGEGVTITNVDVAFNPDTNRVTVDLTANVETTLMGLAGVDHTTASARTVTGLEATAGIPVSLVLVLDVSGSMDWGDKIGDLITAATSLLDQLDAADTAGNRLRTGLITYSSSVQQVVQMDWGIDNTRPVIQTLNAWGGTSSTKAMNKAKNWMIDEDEENAHLEASGQDPLEFVIFMTDGDNNYAIDDTKTQNKCDTIKANDVEVFTVAFEAPAGGQALLEYCADDADHYFDAQNPEEFLEAFEIILEYIQTSMLRIVE